LPYADRLQEELGEHFGADDVFRDVDAIEPGLDFLEAIDRALSETEIMLVVIGPRWLEGAERSRLHEPGDYVRLEIEAGLRRPDLRVIPVLVGGATMPSAGELPEEIQTLARRNGVEMIDRRWRTDQAQLVVVLERVLGRPVLEPAQIADEARTVAAPASTDAPQHISAPTEPNPWYVTAGWVMVVLTAPFWFLAPVPVVLGMLTMRNADERRRRTGLRMIVAALVVGLLSLSVYAVVAWQSGL
jgi:hypothetical protein